MKFRNIILLAIWGVVFALLIAGYFLVNYWMRGHIEARTADNLRSNYSTIGELHNLRLEEIGKSCQIIAETPRLKAVAEIGDENTALQLAQELHHNTLADLFIITDSAGKTLASLVNGKPAILSPAVLPSITNALRKSLYTDAWNIGSTVFRLASSPITVGNDLIGTVTIGFTLKQEHLQSITSMTNCDLLLLTSNEVAASTLPPAAVAELRDWYDTTQNVRIASHQHSIIIHTIPITDDLYGGTILTLSRTTGNPSATNDIHLMIVTSINQEVRAALEPVQRTFLIIAVTVLVVTIGIGFLISQSITRPIAALVRGTAEISKGNYDVRIDVPSSEELKFLAGQFQEMSRALKEKVRQLADRNTDLENALQKLEETQEELVKSERLAATGRLTAQLSHEINNPVHNVLSCLQTALKRTSASSPDRELIEVAHEEMERLARLTKQLLNVYRSSVTQQEPTEPVALHTLINEVLSSSGEMFRQAGIDTNLHFCNSSPVVAGSTDKLKQVFINLFLNARDAMPHGGVLSIETSMNNGSIQVSVSDTGVGIPPENIHRIFDAFFTTKSNVSGVGLGLSVTYGIVKQHNGTITVKSTPGSGTTFSLLFPKTQLPQDRV